MQQYLELIKCIKLHGKSTSDRTGTGTQSIFGYQYRVDLNKGFPLLTTKKINFNMVVHDLLWMLSGSTNVKDLHKHKVNIWDGWADEDGNLGPVYGELWRKFPNTKSAGHLKTLPIDQISEVIKKIQDRPNSRSLIVSSWNPTTVPDENFSPQENVANGKQALASCQTLFQFKVYGSELSLQLYQRSADVAVGVPFNLAEYALLLHIVAHHCDLKVGEFIHTFGDAHIYNNHQEQMDLQLTREPYLLPKLIIKRKHKSIFDYTIYDFELEGYECHPFIRLPIAV